MSRQPTGIDNPIVGFVTPAWRRYDLSDLAFQQRRRMLDELPFEAHAVVVADDMNRDLAHARGLDVVDFPNDRGLGAKFNAGYRRLKELGCTHAMAIGSDSWLHPSAIADSQFYDKNVTSLVGLSSFRPDGMERLDMTIRYAAGFGVGMIYPTAALTDEPCDPRIPKGCDSSTWRRCGNGKLGVVFERLRPLTYLNFTSYDVQVTKYSALKVHRSRAVAVHGDRVFGDLRDVYEADLVDEIERVYAVRAIGMLISGYRPEYEGLSIPKYGGLRRRAQPGYKRRPLGGRGQGARR
jgi:hypothetical protein